MLIQPQGAARRVPSLRQDLQQVQEARPLKGGVRSGATSNKNPNNEEVNLGTVGVLPNYGIFRFHKTKLEPHTRI